MSKTLNKQGTKDNQGPPVLGTDSDCGPSENDVHGHVITHHYNKAELMFDRACFI